MTRLENDAALDIEAAAELIGVTPSALRKWQVAGKGPDYYYAGRLVRYRREAVLEWIARHTITSEDHRSMNPQV